MSHHHHRHQKHTMPTGRVLLVLLLTASYMIAEFIGGLLSHSLALLADAGHMLADVAALSISLFAFMIAKRPPSKKATYGYYRAEVLGAMINGLILLLIAIFIIKEAISRLWEPTHVQTGTMLGVAMGGLVINLLGLYILHKDKKHNFNIKGAWLHVMSDTLGSIGVLISGVLIYLWGWTIADPIASIVIAFLVFYSAAHLVADTMHVLMEHSPAHIDPESVMRAIEELPDALRVHDLHIWSITSGKEALSAHVVVRAGSDYDAVQNRVHEILEQQFGIDHATIQLEKQCVKPDKSC